MVDNKGMSEAEIQSAVDRVNAVSFDNIWFVQPVEELNANGITRIVTSVGNGAIDVVCDVFRSSYAEIIVHSRGDVLGLYEELKDRDRMISDLLEEKGEELIRSAEREACIQTIFKWINAHGNQITIADIVKNVSELRQRGKDECRNLPPDRLRAENENLRRRFQQLADNQTKLSKYAKEAKDLVAELLSECVAHNSEYRHYTIPTIIDKAQEFLSRASDDY